MAARKRVFVCTAAAAALLGLSHIAPTARRADPARSPAAAETASATIFAASPATPEAIALPAPDHARALPEAASPGIISHWQGRLATPLRDRAPAPDADLHLPLRFAFPLSASRQVRVRIDRHDETGPAAGVFTGEAEDQPGSVVILSYFGLAQAGVVQLPAERRSFVINGDETGLIRVTTLDLDRAPGCTPPLVPPLASNP